MRLKEEFNQITVQEIPGCLWMVGLFFAFVGGVFVYGALGGLTDYHKQSPWMISLAGVMGMCAVAAGIWIIYQAPITKVLINRQDQNVLIKRYGLFGKRETVYQFDEIRYFRLIEDRDDEGSPIWSFGIELMNEELVKITSLPSHAEEYERRYVFQTNQFMNKPLPTYQTPDELEGESAAKIS